MFVLTYLLSVRTLPCPLLHQQLIFCFWSTDDDLYFLLVTNSGSWEILSTAWLPYTSFFIFFNNFTWSEPTFVPIFLVGIKNLNMRACASLHLHFRFLCSFTCLILFRNCKVLEDLGSVFFWCPYPPSIYMYLSILLDYTIACTVNPIFSILCHRLL